MLLKAGGRISETGKLFQYFIIRTDDGLALVVFGRCTFTAHFGWGVG